MGIVDEDVARVRENTDIVALITQQTQLRRVGQRWVGLCPFHAEKSPSFSVNQSDGLYYCFGCKASGDAITFVREIEHLDFVAAVETLAAKAGIGLRYTEQGGGEERRKRDHLHDILESAVAWYHDRLRSAADAAAARSYLRSRGFDGDEVGRYRLGWAPDGWDELTRSLKLSRDDLEATGLGMLNRRNRLQDFFRARVLFPIADERGRPIGFGGRKLPGADGPKYQNSRDNVLYHKSKALYGLSEAKADIVNSGEVVICEGYTDVIGFDRAGVPRAVATCGTSLTEDHVKMLSRFTRRLVLAYDADDAGQSAAERVYAWEQAHDVGFWVVDLPEGTDPDDLARRDPTELARAVRDARPFLEFRVGRALSAADMSSAEGRAQGAEAALEVISEHPDSLVVDQYLMELSEGTRIEVARLRERLGEVRRRPRRQVADPGGRGRVGDGSDRRGRSVKDAEDDGELLSRRPPPAVVIPRGAEREALRLAVHHPEIAAPILDVSLFRDPGARAAYEVLSAADTLTDAIQVAPPEIADELTRLSVEEIAVDPVDVLARLGTEVARAELIELEMEARASEDPLAYSEAIGYLKLTLDELRGLSFEEEIVPELLDWLKLRRRQALG